MTFKHGKFEESEIMRSLERVAKEKGMIKEEPLKKEASKKELNLKASSNFIDNILKLCSGLRSSGFNKQADELETNFINFKQANTLYETSKEQGEDLINAAHPKGSHQLEGVIGDGLVETILDRHLKIVKVVNKTPTGKLASSNSVINAVKFALGQDGASSLEKNIISNVEKFKLLWNKVVGETDSQLRSWYSGIVDNLPLGGYRGSYSFHTEALIIDSNLKKPMTLDRLNIIESSLKNAFDSIKSTGKQDLIERVSASFGELNSLVSSMKQDRSKINTSESPSLGNTAPQEKSEMYTLPTVEISGDTTNLINRVEASLELIKSYSSQVDADLEATDEEKKQAINWLASKASIYKKQLAALDGAPEGQKVSASKKLLKNIDILDGQLKEFFNEWLAE